MQEWKHGRLEGLRALSLWEPWASLVAHGHKEWETRSWTTPQRCPLAIHASKTDKYAGEIVRLFREAGLPDEELDAFLKAVCQPTGHWPLGCITAIVRLENVLPTGAVRHTLSRKEKTFGNYEDRRFAWRMTDRYLLKEPVPARGMQCLWQPSPEIRQRILDQVYTPSCIN